MEAGLHMARIGSYSFPIKSMVELVGELARRPKLMEAKLLALDEDELQRRGGMGPARESFRAFIRKRASGDIIPQEDTMEASERFVELKITMERDEVSIGRYVFDSRTFGMFAAYLPEGGFVGWSAVPAFAAGVRQEIEVSKHPVYKSFQFLTSELRK